MFTIMEIQSKGLKSWNADKDKTSYQLMCDWLNNICFQVILWLNSKSEQFISENKMCFYYFALANCRFYRSGFKNTFSNVPNFEMWHRCRTAVEENNKLF